MHVEAPAHAQRRERQQDAERVAVKGRDRADLDEGRLAHEADRAAARDRPGGVARQAVRGLGELELEALGERDERVEEAGGQRDVVVDDEHPVVA